MNKSKFLSKFSLVASAVLLLVMQLDAAPVSLHEAQNVALNWMKQTTGRHFVIKEKMQKLSATSNRAKNPTFHSSTYRIIMLEPKGWVIVSSDDIANPIIAYGQSRIDPSSVPPAFAQWMRDVDSEIKAGIRATKSKSPSKKLSATQTKLSSQWNSLKAPNKLSAKRLGAGGAYVVKPLLWMGGDDENSGIRWDQSKYYNRECPTDSSAPAIADGHVFAGCVATAVGQVFRYYKEPAVGKSSHGYNDRNYGWQSADFGNTAYDWDNMPLKLDNNSSSSEVDAVATLLYHIGVAVDMEYGTGGSSAYYGGSTGAAEAVKKYFRFDDAKIASKDNYSDARWKSIIKRSLDDKDPILYAGEEPRKNGGHAFVLDGYTNDGYYHFNWGFSGAYNGNFLLSHLVFTVTYDNGSSEEWNFTDNQRAIFMKGIYGIDPDRYGSSRSDEEWGNDAYNSASIGYALGFLLPLFGLFVIYRRERFV